MGRLKNNKTTKFWVRSLCLQSPHLRGFELDIRSLRWSVACARARREEGGQGEREPRVIVGE